MSTVTLKPGREGPVRAGHPWVFSGAIARIAGEEPPGALAQVIAADGSELGIGYVNTRCSIAVRMLSRAIKKPEQVDAEFIHGRLEQALSLRRAVVPPDTTGYRLVNGEGDFLPGLIVDVYGHFVVCQCLTAGADRLKPLVVEALAALLPLRGIYEKSEGGVRQEEGLANVAGTLWGEEPPPCLRFLRTAAGFSSISVEGKKPASFSISVTIALWLAGWL